MSKQSERLFEAISHLNDEILDPALEPRRRKTKYHWKRWAALAACLCLVVGVVRLLPLLGGRSGSDSGASGASAFQSYAGPVLPMTLREENENITAQRAITLDFAPWVPVWDEELERYDDHILVTDEYTLTNTGEEDQTLTLLYPFVTNLNREGQPVLEAEGEKLETVFHWGSYAGFFKGSLDDTRLDGEQGDSSSLTGPNCWEDYRNLLSDGSYLARALGDTPDVSQVPVTVYKLTEPYGPARSQEAPNPTIRVSMELDYEQTHVLSYGFNGGAYDLENGRMVQSFSIPEEGDPEDGQTYYLLVLGDDVDNLTMSGYVTGGLDEDDPELEGCGVTVERYESDLETVLREVLAQYCNQRTYITQHDPEILEVRYRAVVEQLLLYGPLESQSTQRYAYGPLEDLFSDAWDFQRVCWLETQVTVPAGGSLTVTVSMEKEASYDYSCDRANQGTRDRKSVV